MKTWRYLGLKAFLIFSKVTLWTVSTFSQDGRGLVIGECTFLCIHTAYWYTMHTLFHSEFLRCGKRKIEGCSVVCISKLAPEVWVSCEFSMAWITEQKSQIFESSLKFLEKLINKSYHVSPAWTAQTSQHLELLRCTFHSLIKLC